MQAQLSNMIANRSARIAVVGLGYVGLPFAVAFAKKGFDVFGIDVVADKVAALNRGESYVQDIPSSRVVPLVCPASDAITPAARRKYWATTDYSVLEHCDAAIICVPTPLNKTHDPDVHYILAAGEALARQVHPGTPIVLDPTTYPGTTRRFGSDGMHTND